MLSGIAYFTSSLAAGGPLSRVPSRLLVVADNTAMSLLLLAAVTSAFGLVTTVALYTIASLDASIGWVRLAHLLSSETPAGVGTTKVLNRSLFNVGAARGRARSRDRRLMANQRSIGLPDQSTTASMSSTQLPSGSSM